MCCVCVYSVCDEKRCWLICVNKANAVMVQCQQPDDENDDDRKPAKTKLTTTTTANAQLV